MVAIIDGKIGKPNPEDLFTIPDLTTRYGDQFFFGVDPDTGTSVLYLQKDPTKPINQGAGANDKPIKMGFLNPEIFGGDTTLPRSSSGVIGPLGLQSPFIYNNPDFFRTQTPFIGGFFQQDVRKRSLNIINDPNIIGGNHDGSDPDIFAGDVIKGPNQSKAFNAAFSSTLNPAVKDPNSLNPFAWPFLPNEAILAAQRTCEASNADPLVGCRGSAELLTQVGVTEGFFTPEIQRILNVTITGEPTGRPTFGEVGFEFDTELGLLDPGLSSVSRRPSGSSSGGLLKYPLYDISDFGYDYLYIRRYTVRQGNPENKPGTAFTEIYLPMQPNLEEDNGVNWGADTLNTLQARLVDSAINAMDAAGNADGLGRALSEMASSLVMDAKNLLEDGKKVSGQLKNAAIAYFAGQAVGANIFTRETGSVINPNMELLFNEPQLRTFNFNFSMTPRFEAEANVIRSIIRELKIGMAPKAIEPYFFLYSPDVFELEYRYNGTQHPFMHKFKKRCALTSFSVDYTPSNSYMTYKSNGSMTQYNLSMSFSELEPTYESDQVGGTGT